MGEGLKVTSKLNKGTNMSFLVYDKSLKNTESKEDREERAVIIMRDGKNFKNIDEISESSENYEQRTIEISDHIFMIENKLKLKKLKFLNNEMTDRDLLSSLYSNISSGKGNTNNSNLISEQICNNSFSNKKIGVNFRNDLKKENTNSNFLLPFSNSSIIYQRNRRKSHTKIDSSNSLNIISNKSNQKIKLTNSICNRSSKLLKLNSEKTKIFKNMSKIFQFTFTNLNPVVEINFEISSAKNLVSRSGKHKFSTRKNFYTKFGNFDEENSLQETNVTRRKSSGLKSLLFKRFNTLKNNEDSLPISLEFRNTIEKTKNVNVLIIDDEKSMRSFSKNIQKKLCEKININFIIDEAHDGSEGLSKIFGKLSKDQEIFDLIITDDSMTTIDGSNLFNIISFIIENEMIKLSQNLFDKFIICTSDVDNVRSKIMVNRNTDNFTFKNLILSEKPLKVDLIKHFYSNSKILV